MSGEVHHIDQALTSSDIRRIRQIAPGISPRHVEAWMRVGGADIKRLRRLADSGYPYAFECEVLACVSCIRAKPAAFSEQLARGDL